MGFEASHSKDRMVSAAAQRKLSFHNRIGNYGSHSSDGIPVQALVSGLQRCILEIDACSAQMVPAGELD